VVSDAPRALFPLPVADADTQPFWDAAAEHRLVVPRCSECGKWIWQPKPLCPACHATEPVWTQVTGGGRVASWTVIHPPVLPAFADTVPFVILLVELDEGVRMVGQLVDESGGLLVTDGTDVGLAMGTLVGLRWREQGGVTLPAWGIV
jgi:uncharacterized OB-fold protein